MRKNSIIIIISALFSILLMTAELNATEKYGTFIIGGKAWGALWDSAINKLQKKDAQKNALRQSFIMPLYDSYNVKGPGKGILGGPIIGYQTPDKKWSFSLAFMWFSYFEIEARETKIYFFSSNAFPDVNSYTFKYDRREVDFAPGYSIDQYWKVFLGYKFQWIKIKDATTVEVMNHSIAPGAGFYYPLGQYFVLGVQAGLLCVIPQPSESKSSPFDLVAKSADKINMGINGEISISTLIADHLVLQLGYRVQVQWIDLVGATIKMHTSDIFHGITLTVAASF